MLEEQTHPEEDMPESAAVPCAAESETAEQPVNSKVFVSVAADASSEIFDAFAASVVPRFILVGVDGRNAHPS